MALPMGKICWIRWTIPEPVDCQSFLSTDWQVFEVLSDVPSQELSFARADGRQTQPCLSPDASCSGVSSVRLCTQLWEMSPRHSIPRTLPFSHLSLIAPSSIHWIKSPWGVLEVGDSEPVQRALEGEREFKKENRTISHVFWKTSVRPSTESINSLNNTESERKLRPCFVIAS